MRIEINIYEDDKEDCTIKQPSKKFVFKNAAYNYSTSREGYTPMYSSLGEFPLYNPPRLQQHVSFDIDAIDIQIEEI